MSIIPRALRNIARLAALPFGYNIASSCLPLNSLLIPFIALNAEYQDTDLKSLTKPIGFLLPNIRGVKNSGIDASDTKGINVTGVKLVNH